MSIHRSKFVRRALCLIPPGICAAVLVMSLLSAGATPADRAAIADPPHPLPTRIEPVVSAQHRKPPVRIAADAVPEDTGRRMSTESDKLGELASLADQGDIGASCRLAAILEFCGSADDSETLLNAQVDSASGLVPGSPEETAAIRTIMEFDRVAALHRTTCEGLVEADFSELTKRTLQAARLGVASAAVRFFRRPELLTQRRNLDVKMASIYHEEAFALLEQAARNGHGEALYWVFRGYEQGEYQSTSVFLTIGRNPARAVAAGHALLRNSDPALAKDVNDSIEALKSTMSAEELGRVSQYQKLYPAPTRRFEHYASFAPADQELRDCTDQ